MSDRPTWALIDDATQALGVVEGLANTIAQRRGGADARIARQASLAAREASRKLALINREDEE